VSTAALTFTTTISLDGGRLPVAGHSNPSEMKKQWRAGVPRLKTIDAANAVNVTGGTQ